MLVCPVCLRCVGRQKVSEILENLPYQLAAGPQKRVCN